MRKGRSKDMGIIGKCIAGWAGDLVHFCIENPVVLIALIFSAYAMSRYIIPGGWSAWKALFVLWGASICLLPVLLVRLALRAHSLRTS